MSLQSDRWIRQMAKTHGMIEPFVETQVRYVEGERVISFGLSSYGYDLRVANEFKIFTNLYNSIVDPKSFNENAFVSVEAKECIIPPNSFALARSVEYFRIPRNVLTLCVGKSTYARCGIIVNVTPFEPEWEGYVTLKSPIPHLFLPRSTPMKALPKCSFIKRKMCARPPMQTAKESIWDRPGSRFLLLKIKFILRIGLKEDKGLFLCSG